jgi:hypothetical protein
MVMSVTPMVCITLAFWLGRIGLTASGGCCADANGAAQIAANRIAKQKSESRISEIIGSVLLIDFEALSIAAPSMSKSNCLILNSSLRNLSVLCASAVNSAKIHSPRRRRERRDGAEKMTLEH